MFKFFLQSCLLLLPVFFNPPGAKPEEWNSIYLSKDQLTPTLPLVGERDTFPDFTRELVQVQWRARDPITLFIALPKGIQKPPVILYLYTYDTSSDRFLREAFVRQLVEGGYAAVGFSAALDGQRYHDRPMREWFISELPKALSGTTHDVQRILDYLGTRGDIDVNRVGMFGEGSGGAIAVLAAAADPRLKAIDLLNPWGNWPTWLAQSTIIPVGERSSYLAPEFLASIANLDPVRWLPRLRIPVRLQFMGADLSTPRGVRESMEAAVPPQALVIPPEQGIAEYRATGGSSFLNWIKDRLRR